MTRRRGTALQAAFAAAMMVAAATAASAQEQVDQASAQTDAKERAALAAIAEANAKIATQNAATTAALVSPLTDLAGSGKRELADKAGQIEVALLGSATLQTLAVEIAEAIGNAPVVLLVDDERPNLAAKWQFDAEVAQIGRRLDRVAAAGKSVCPATGTSTSQTHSALGPSLFAGGPFALLGAIGSLLQSDVKVTGVAYAPKSRILASLVAARPGLNALLPGEYLLPFERAQIEAKLASLDDREVVASRAVRECSALDPGKRNASQTALVAEYTSAGTGLTSLRSRLYTPDASGRVPLMDVALASKVVGRKLVRLRVEDAGGSVITTRNILTAFGAPSLNLTAGLVASYVMSDPAEGRVLGGRLYACRSKARMLRSVHRAGSPERTSCDAVTTLGAG